MALSSLLRGNPRSLRNILAAATASAIPLLLVCLVGIGPILASAAGTDGDGSSSSPSSPIGGRFRLHLHVNTSSSLEGNMDVIGAHLHTGGPTTNGPVNVIFCGNDPLPAPLLINGPCELTDSMVDDESGRFLAHLVAEGSRGAWDDGGNGATAAKGATSLADGAATTPESFLRALDECGAIEESEGGCDVYFNFHTKYSFEYNLGKATGLARAQLKEVSCPPEADAEEGDRCFGTAGLISSNRTNMLEGQLDGFTALPDDAGQALGISDGTSDGAGDAIVIYSPHSASVNSSEGGGEGQETNSTTEDDGKDESTGGSSSASVPRRSLFVAVAAFGAAVKFLAS